MLCGTCGGGFEALSRPSGRRRAFVYGCATHRPKGACICANGLLVLMEEADSSVLATVEATLLHPAVITHALAYAEAAIAEDRTADRRQTLDADLADVEKAITRLTAASWPVANSTRSWRRSTPTSGGARISRPGSPRSRLRGRRSIPW